MGDDRRDMYASSGVDYDHLDRTKREAVAAARATSALAALRGVTIDDASRGESALVLTVGGTTLSFVVEGLGTKSLIAVAYERATGVGRFDSIAYDAVAAIANDLICVGALPAVVNAYFATGDSGWYAQERRLGQLIDGWERACRDCGAAWGGGESPNLPGLVAADGIELAGSAIGVLPAGAHPILGRELAVGDEIVLVESSGLHANGASLARMLASRLPGGWETPLPSGRAFGDALLDPSVQYTRLVAALLERSVPVTYLSHITGHGLRKLMRPDRDLGYVVDALPPVPEVLSFMVDQLGMEPAEAYGTLNMGAGFAVTVRPGAGEDVVAAARDCGLSSIVGGRVEPGPRRVVLRPLGVTFTSDELSVR